VQTIPVLGGRYRLGPEIGSGGMGAVHRAWDERFEREVAIKIVRSGGVEKERLRREAQYLAHLDHPNLVAVLDAGEDVLRRTDTVWFAMELVHGPDLRTVLRQDGPMEGAAVRKILLGTLAALDTLHTAGVVHRDMKPANLLLTAEPSTGRWDVKLVDLGIAQHIRTDHLTSTGQIVGTAAYLSPEQVSGHAIGPATDVYALGLLAIEALSGRIAFPGGPAESAAARLVRAPELPRALDHGWRTVLTAMTALDPANRPAVQKLIEIVRRLPDTAQGPTAADMPTALIPVLPADQPTESMAATALLPLAPAAGARPRSRPGRERRRRNLLATACVLLVLAAAGGWIAALSGGAQPTASAATPAPVTTVTVHPAAQTSSPVPTTTGTVAPQVTTAPTAAVTDWKAARQSSRAAEQAAKKLAERIKDSLHHQHPHR
jgi:serine/threonine protein kinase